MPRKVTYSLRSQAQTSVGRSKQTWPIMECFLRVPILLLFSIFTELSENIPRKVFLWNIWRTFWGTSLQVLLIIWLFSFISFGNKPTKWPAQLHIQNSGPDLPQWKNKNKHQEIKYLFLSFRVAGYLWTKTG